MTNFTNRFAPVFTADQANALESVLISMLDSGTLSEEHAMSINELNTVVAIRNYGNANDIDDTLIEYIIVVAMDKAEEPVIPAHAGFVDLSGYVEGWTGEEINNLNSMFKAMGAEPIRPTLKQVQTIVDDLPF